MFTALAHVLVVLLSVAALVLPVTFEVPPALTPSFPETGRRRRHLP